MSARSTRQAATGAVAVVVAAAVAAAIGMAGQLIPVQRAQVAAAAPPLQGRTSSVCTTGTLNPGPNSDGSQSQVYAATTSAQAGATGTLTGRSIGAGDTGTPALSIDRQGQDRIVNSPDRSMVLVADGVLAGASAGMVYGSTNTGEDRGLSLGPCTAPAVEQWFTGLGATDSLRSQLVLTNPDDRQAAVDLEFFGPHGALTVPGGSGLIIAAGTSRTLSLADLLGNIDGEISVRVKASVGRVAAIARDLRSDNRGTPTGVDWHPASAAPATTQIIPAIPGGPGYRKVIVFNQGDRRADVRIEILGPDGPFAPAGAASISVDGHASASLDVASGLAKSIGTIRLTSDQPIVSAVRSEQPAGKAAGDIAINTAQQPITGMAMAPAAVVGGSETELAISNGGGAIRTADVTLYNPDGVSLYHERIPVPPDGSIERRVNQAGPAYLVVRTPDDSALYGGITLRQTSDTGVSGLTAAALITPALAGQGRRTVEDPQVAQQ